MIMCKLPFLGKEIIQRLYWLSVFCTGFFNKITEYGFVIKKYGFLINPGKKIIVASVYGDQCLKGAFFTGNPRSLQQKW